MKRARWLLVASVIPRPALACSGPGAMETILANERVGWTLFFVSAAIAAVAAVLLRSRGWRKLWPLAAVVFVHPGWWLSARSGDCGGTLHMASIAITIVTLLVAGVVWWRGRHGFTASARSRSASSSR
jgi:hypothetical protein